MLNMSRYLRLLLFPFSLLYGFVIMLRNQLYNWGVFKSTKFNLPIICVGNLAVGGTGKTPVTEYLVNLLSSYKIAILSRGYGRKTKGFILADADANAQTIGDEPMQFHQKFSNVTVAVCEDRVKGINLLKNNHDLIILDDAFQHRAVTPGFSILLFDFNKLQKMDWLLPAGNLRDTRSSRKRADILVVTKSPLPLLPHHIHESENEIQPLDKQKVVFSFIKYGALKHLFTTDERVLTSLKSGTQIFLLTGIANTAPLLDELRKYSNNIHHQAYPDHHAFTEQNCIKLKTDFDNHPTQEKIIITTEKDAQRLIHGANREIMLNLPIYYLPIQIDFIAHDKATFDKQILNYVESATRNR